MASVEFPDNSKGQIGAEGSSGPSTPPFSSLDLSDRKVTDLEQDVTIRVSEAFPNQSVRANAVAVHKLDGGEIGTLRFTVDDMASSDLELQRLEQKGESAESLAHEVIEDLMGQLT